jgi:hypothetical protein
VKDPTDINEGHKPAHRNNFRHNLTRKVARDINDEFNCQRTRQTRLGDKFEEFKVKLRYRFTKEELEELALLAASVVVEVGTEYSIHEKRYAIDSRGKNKIRDNR